MLGSHFYDEIYEDQGHIRLIAQICREAKTEKDIMTLSTAILTGVSALNNHSESAEINDYTIHTVQKSMSKTQGSRRIRCIRLLDNSDECLLAEMETVPYVSNPTSMRVVRSHSQILLRKNISIDQLRECCALPCLQQVQYKARFKNRHYHISKSGVATLVPDSHQ